MPGPSGPALVGALNDRRVVELMLEHGPLTRARISTLSGLSKQTAAQAVTRLENKGIIAPVARVSAGRGPDASAYDAVDTGHVGVAVAVDQDAVAATVLDVKGTELGTVRRPRELAAGVGELAEVVTAACRSAGVPRDGLDLAVVGVSASVDPVTDALRFADDFPGWPASGVRRALADALGCDVQLDNDVKLAAVAEREHGAGRGTPGFVELWSGPGVGLAVDLAGIVVQGVAGAAGEIGYLPVPAEIQLTDPVEPATLHHLLSLEAVRELAARGTPGTAALDDAAATAAVVADDEKLNTLARRIALSVAPVLATLDPGLLVLAGPPATAGGDRLAGLVAHWLSASTPWHTRVAASEVDDAVLQGARDLLCQGLRDRLLAAAGRVD
ncbi:ROK family transcriptional regulator [Luteimicrobium xylanilyticum]|uniref:Glucokinase n=1 Tax=Luteimicrobium xylanilyticum TaxID=1133546 RepID=A0A5P9QBE1_9MICO|nr:ROK family transcriptional regulator [Luteimicrobium xylanilyticum]QFU98771.1 Glucokinase [Luteimicrobium xylanilyticum]